MSFLYHDSLMLWYIAVPVTVAFSGSNFGKITSNNYWKLYSYIPIVINCLWFKKSSSVLPPKTHCYYLCGEQLTFSLTKYFESSIYAKRKVLPTAVWTTLFTHHDIFHPNNKACIFLSSIISHFLNFLHKAVSSLSTITLTLFLFKNLKDNLQWTFKQSFLLTFGRSGSPWLIWAMHLTTVNYFQRTWAH